jgi:hypothetical protein
MGRVHCCFQLGAFEYGDDQPPIGLRGICASLTIAL